MGGSFLLWLMLYSTSGDKVLGRFNIFAYAFRELDGPEDFSWLWGKAAGILIAVFLLGVAAPYFKEKRMKEFNMRLGSAFEEGGG